MEGEVIGAKSPLGVYVTYQLKIHLTLCLGVWREGRGKDQGGGRSSRREQMRWSLSFVVMFQEIIGWKTRIGIPRFVWLQGEKERKLYIL